MSTVEQPPRLAEIDEIMWGKDRKELTEQERKDLYEERWRIQDQTLCYFRLNIYGMRTYRNVMEQIGMLEWDANPNGLDWPSYEQYNVPMKDVEYNGQLYSEPNESSPEYVEWQKAQDEKLRWSGTTVMPGHKFCSNDGWIVTPREIAKALDVWYEWRKEHDVCELLGSDDADPTYWNKWIAFLETACEAGGFSVH